MAEDKLPRFIEDDDVARAKAFWNENGKSIVAGVIIGLGGIVGFNYWKSYQQTEGENASFLFDRLSSGQNDIDHDIDMNSVADELKEKYASTVYADLAALAMAKQFVEKNDLAAAARELNWVMDHSKDSGFQHIARLRLAAVALAQQRPDQALAILTITDTGGFESRYHELTADAYAQRGQATKNQGAENITAENQDEDNERARLEYQKSLETLPDGSSHAGLIQLKRDNVGESP
ncbi:YfgM family protein [Candidatus Spongiihabitans sp.]|uniref:YfgM family protein n=1 Tax=Candidatus Spongiihabitans sp. TaxID=3101308 RepID=UPI003C7E0F9D